MRQAFFSLGNSTAHNIRRKEMNKVTKLKSWKRFGKVCLLAAGTVFVLYGATAFAKEWPKNVTIGATTLKGSFYPIAMGWAQQLKKHANISATPLALGGSSAIAAQMGSGQLQMGP